MANPSKEKGTKASYLDRLLLTEARIEQMAEGLRQTASLPDPVAECDCGTRRPNGLEIRVVAKTDDVDFVVG